MHWSVPKDDLLKIYMFEAKVHMTTCISDKRNINKPALYYQYYGIYFKNYFSNSH